MGKLTSNVAEAGGFTKVLQGSPYPDLQFHFAPVFFITHGARSPEAHGLTLGPSLVLPKSVGYVDLRSADPLDKVLIDHNYLSHQDDMQILVEGVKQARKVLKTSPFEPYLGDVHIPGPEIQSDEEIAEFIRDYYQTVYHPTGTCKMGNDDMSVVDSQLRVQGLLGLRVADASIMPFIVNANTQASCVMIGEKCANMILQKKDPIAKL